MNTHSALRCAAFGAVLLPLLALAGCGGQDLSRTFGLTHASPDEFTVTTRAPLSMPPDFSLRPPDPGAARPQEQSATQTAEVTVAGAAALNAPSGPGDSPGQDALLAAAGTPAPGDIRTVVNAEAQEAADNRPLSEELLFWKQPAPLGTALDPQKEAERLRENAALGRSPDVGSTPIIQKKSNSFFDTLF